MALVLRHFSFVAIAAFLAGTARAVAVTPAFATTLVAIAVAVRFSHHGRGAGLKLFHPHRHGA
jgi:hypothetical protein